MIMYMHLLTITNFRYGTQWPDGGRECFWAKAMNELEGEEQNEWDKSHGTV